LWLPCLQTGDTLNVATSPKRRAFQVVITNNTHVNRHNTGGKYRQKCTGRGGIRTAGKCRTDASVWRFCVASLLGVPLNGNSVLVYEILYWYRDKRSHQLYSVQFHALKRYKFSQFLQKNHSRLSQRVLLQKKKKKKMKNSSSYQQ